MTRGLQALVFELYCLDKALEPIDLNPIENELTKGLEIPSVAIEQAVSSMQRYIEKPQLEAAFAMAQEAQLFPPERLRTVERVLRLMKIPLLRPIINSMVFPASAKIFEIVVERVLTELEQRANSLEEPDYVTIR